MLKGQLSEMQRDRAWEGKDLAERTGASVLPDGDDPNEQTPEQIAFRARLERQEKLSSDLGKGGEENSRSAGVGPTGDAAVRDVQAKQLQDSEKRRKEQTETQMLLATLDQARAFADQRGRDADRFEDGFEERFGDAWREEIANRVMEPDDVPQRMDGESIEDYRARLEDELIETMIDPETGEIRPEYADNPEHAEYAEWAKARYDEREARAYIERRSDPNLTPEQQRAIDVEFTASATWNEITQAAQEAALDGGSVQAVADEMDTRTAEARSALSPDAGASAFS